MNRFRLGLIIILCAFIGLMQWQEAQGKGNLKKSPVEEYRNDQIIITPNQYIPANEITSLARSNNAKIKKRFAHANCYVVSVPRGMDVKGTIAFYKKQSNIKYAEPDHIVHSTINPNDTYFSRLYGLHNTGQNGGTSDADIDSPEAWNVRTDCSDVVVAVIDTGVDYNHSDLATNMWKNPGEISGDLIDNDNNGYIDDIYGIDTSNDDSDPMDDDRHGTHVSGIIGAVGDNGYAVTGVCWKAKIMSLKFLNQNGSGTTSDAIECIDYMVEMKNRGVNVKVANSSWGGTSYSHALYDAIVMAMNADILFVAAAGNNYGQNNDNNPHYPANYSVENVISVAATDRNDNLAFFSNIGPTTVDLAAAGYAIYSTIPGNKFASLSGTSMATPYVSGAAALVSSDSPTLNYAGIKNWIMNNVDAKPALSGKVLTGGRLNIRMLPTGDEDGDTLSNQEEYFVHGTDPKNADTEGDGMPDGWEVSNSLDPLTNDANNDLDGDGKSNLEEYQAGTNPNIVTDLVLANITIPSASVEVYEAENSITAGPSYTINSVADVSFKAGSTIILKSGFTAREGSRFHAYIGVMQ